MFAAPRVSSSSHATAVAEASGDDPHAKLAVFTNLINMYTGSNIQITCDHILCAACGPLRGGAGLVGLAKARLRFDLLEKTIVGQPGGTVPLRQTFYKARGKPARPCLKKCNNKRNGMAACRKH